MSIIMPRVIGYEVCEYTNKSMQWSSMSKDSLKATLDKRQFKVIKRFDDLQEARKMLEKDRDRDTHETPYVLRYIFQEIESDEPVH